ncbi:hypothetical protein MMC25_000426 [Agyrium rufum]|nr:hypothetical protein [Agyrium rufum]
MPPSTLPLISKSYPSTTLNAGNGLFALADIEAGELIVRTPYALVAVPDSPHLNDTCSHCFVCVSEVGTSLPPALRGDADVEGEDEDSGAVGVTLRKCTGCQIVRYCGKDCQTASWKKSHKYTCKIFKSLYPDVLPNTVRMALELLLRRKNLSIPDEDWGALMKLGHHLDDFRNAGAEGGAETWQNVELMAKAAKEYSGTKESLEFVQMVICRIMTNTLTLTTPVYTPLGLYLSPLLSTCNHSCRPNAVISYSESYASLRALMPIAKDDEIYISYCDITHLTSTRRPELLSRYFFNCQCPECSANMTLGNLDTPPNLPPSLSTQDLSDLEARGAEALIDYRTRKQTSRSEAISSLRAGMALFKPLQSFFPLYRQPYALLRSELVVALIETQDHAGALGHTLVKHFLIDPVHLQQPFHPLRVVHMYVLWKLLVEVEGQVQDAAASSTDFKRQLREWKDVRSLAVDKSVVIWSLMRDMRDLVKIGHGPESVFAKTIEREIDAAGMGVKDGGWPKKYEEEQWEKLRKWAEKNT